ncbi:MAG: dihydroneopterin aldolase [Alistipes sp.]|nr:dihydroneopterin aldolase [Alistipes sp.]
MLYTIRLQEMEFRAYHGCYDLEQKVGNRFNVELVITTHLGDVANDDAVEKAVNYLTVYEITREQMAVTQRTIERVAQNIIGAVKSHFPQIVEVECTVAKLAPPLGGKVGRVSVTLKG